MLDACYANVLNEGGDARTRTQEGHAMETGSTGSEHATARWVAALVERTCGVRPRVALGLAGVADDGTLRVPRTLRARIRYWQGQRWADPVVRVEGERGPLVLLDAHPIRGTVARPMRHGERAWHVVAVRRDGDGLAVVDGVLRAAGTTASARSWRIARTLGDARRAPSAATMPASWPVRPIPAPPPPHAPVQGELPGPGRVGLALFAHPPIADFGDGQLPRNDCERKEAT